RSRGRCLYRAPGEVRPRRLGPRDRGPPGSVQDGWQSRLTLRGTGDYCAGSTVIGSMVLLPPRRTSKCRRGLDAPPVAPARAMVGPVAVLSPFLASSASSVPSGGM